MSKKMARLYEKAWNETVEGLNKWKKDIIINNFPYVLSKLAKTSLYNLSIRPETNGYSSIAKEVIACSISCTYTSCGD